MNELASAIVGAKRPTVEIAWVKADGSAENLGAATLTGRIHSVRSGVTRDITGVITVTNGASGLFEWAYSTEDVATSGLHYVQFSADFTGDQPKPAKTFNALWYVELSL